MTHYPHSRVTKRKALLLHNIDAGCWSSNSASSGYRLGGTISHVAESLNIFSGGGAHA